MSTNHDDVAAVQSIAGVELNYKTFPSTSAPARPQPQALRQPSLQVVQPSRAVSPPPVSRHRRSLFEDSGQRVDRAEEVPSWGAHLPPTSISIASMSGGVGVTTVQATLGRVLSERGLSTLLVERSKDGLLPHHFGASVDGWGRSMFPAGDSGRRAPVAVLSGGVGPESIAEDVLWKMIDSHRSTADWVLFEEWADAAEDTRAIWNTEACRVIVLVPDPQTAIRIRRWESSQQPREKLFFVLNKFDPAVPLHREMREWLARKLGDQLLEVTIRRSDTIADAVAEGMTVAEFAPTAAVTQDFLHLADWFQQRVARVRNASVGD